MYTLSFFLMRSSSKHWKLLNLSNCYLDDSHFKILSKSCLSDTPCNLVIKTLDISSNNITSSSLHDICKLLLNLKIQKLIVNNSLSDEEISAALFSIVVNDDRCKFYLPLTVVSSQGNKSSVSCRLGSCCDCTSFEHTTSIYVINCKCKELLISLSKKDYLAHAQHLFIWNSTLNIDNLKMLSSCNVNLLISFVNTSLNDSELNNFQSEIQQHFALSLHAKGKSNYIMKSEKRLLIYGADIQHSVLLFKNSFTNLSVLQVTNCVLTLEALHCIGAIISNKRINWEMVDLSDCGINDNDFMVLCSYFTGVTSDHIKVAISIKVFNISDNCLTSLSVPTIMDSLKHCIVNQYILSHNSIPQQELSDTFITEVRTELISLNFLQKYPLIIVNDAKSLNKEFRNVCNIYIINCEIDGSVFEIVLKNHWTINELILLNNDFYMDKVEKFTEYLPDLQIEKIRIFQAGISDLVAVSLAQLKKFTKFEYVLLSQTKLLCYQTGSKQIDKTISHHPNNSLTYLQITDCHITNSEVIKIILNKCSSKLEFINFTGSSIKDKGWLDLHTYFTGKEKPLHLKVLNLTNTGLSSSSITLLANALHSCVIEKLLITHNNLNHQEFHNAILSGIQSTHSFLNFNLHTPLFVIFSKCCCGNLHCTKNRSKYAYVYIVNSDITEDTMTNFNELSEEHVIVERLVLSNNKIELNDVDILSLALQQQHLKINKIINTNKLEIKDRCSEKTNKTNPIMHQSSRCIIVFKTQLLSFRTFHRQIIELLTDHIVPGALNVDTLQIINCKIPLLELSQLGKVISASKRQWRSIDLSGCNIGDRGCDAMSHKCIEYSKINEVTVKLLNLSSNGLTSASLKNLGTLVLLWKIEKLIISCNHVCQYHLSHTISTMSKLETFEQFSFQIQTTAEHKSIVIHNQSNCQQYLAKILPLESLIFGAMISDEIKYCKEILESSSVQPPLCESYNTSFISLPDILQQAPPVLNTVSVGMHNTQSYFNLTKGIIPYSNFIYVKQEVKYNAPIKHVHITNSNITNETACEVAKIISYGNLLESIELVNNSIAEEDIIKIMTSLQYTSTLTYLCFSNNVVSDAAAQSFASAISDNFCLKHFQFSYCELREKGMLTIIGSLEMINTL